jgi:hypothetical protein
MRRFFASLGLACLLSGSALAGEIPSLGAPQPPPPAITSTTSPGDIPISGAPGDVPTVGGTVLSALLTVFNLLSV